MHKICQFCQNVFHKRPRVSFSRWEKTACCSHQCAAQIRNPPVEDRFWKRVPSRPIGECWLWNGSRSGFGHGILDKTGGAQQLAHRLSYEMQNGQIPEGLVVRHKCDVPSCVNPDHLEVGTQKDNILDAVKRGRWQKGERSGKTFLKSDEVLKIYNSKGRYVDIAKKFNVRPSLVRSIHTGRTWSHLTKTEK